MIIRIMTHMIILSICGKMMPSFRYIFLIGIHESTCSSVLLSDEINEKLDEEFKLNYVVKFSNAKTKEELAVLEFDDTIKMEKKESKVNVSFLFVPFLALHL